MNPENQTAPNPKNRMEQIEAQMMELRHTDALTIEQEQLVTELREEYNQLLLDNLDKEP